MAHEGEAMGVAYLNFPKSLDSVSCNTLIEKQIKHGFLKCTVRWTENHSVLPLEGQVTNGKQLGREPHEVLLDKKLHMSQQCVLGPTTLALCATLGKALSAGQGR